MYQVCNRIKSRIVLVKLKGQHNLNSGLAIKRIKGRIETMQQEMKDKNWLEQNRLQENLGEKYRKEEVFWQQKSRIQWLKEGDQNTKFFHIHTMQRRKKNCIERLISNQVMNVGHRTSWKGKSLAVIRNCLLQLTLQTRRKAWQVYNHPSLTQ